MLEILLFRVRVLSEELDERLKVWRLFLDQPDSHVLVSASGLEVAFLGLLRAAHVTRTASVIHGQS